MEYVFPPPRDVNALVALIWTLVREIPIDLAADLVRRL
jgi:hypothetical protein